MRPVQPSQQRSVPETLPCVNGALDMRSNVLQFLDIVRWAVRQRELMVKRGWTRLDHDFTTRMLMPLQVWLEQHPNYASRESVRSCWSRYGVNIRAIMPGTSAGRKKLHQLENVLFAL